MSDDKALEDLKAAYAVNIIRGYEDGTFKPYEDVSRAHIAQMIAKAYEQETGSAYEPDGETSFPDIGHYDKKTQDAILTMKELGIAKGDHGEFKPDDTTTRAQAATMLVRFDKILEH